MTCLSDYILLRYLFFFLFASFSKSLCDGPWFPIICCIILDLGVEKGIKLEGLSEAQIFKALEDLVKAGQSMKAWYCCLCTVWSGINALLLLLLLQIAFWFKISQVFFYVPWPLVSACLWILHRFKYDTVEFKFKILVLHVEQIEGDLFRPKIIILILVHMTTDFCQRLTCQRTWFCIGCVTITEAQTHP